jgi:N-hydroxyarylamine O-acetyltransferase
MSNENSFQAKYVFSLEQVNASDFDAICTDKQINPSSYFVKNTVCTKPTAFGRVTLFNDKLIEKKMGEKMEKTIYSDLERRTALKKYFAIEISA